MERDTLNDSLPGNASRRGFTLVELLVVIAIIGILVALLLPAVQAAREAARRTQCKNQLKQLGLSALNHESTVGFYPSGGWGWSWVGDPDQGFGENQPGGWAFSLLPFMEEQATFDAGAGLPPTDKRAAVTQMLLRPIKNFNCPSRRGESVRPVWQTAGIMLRNTDRFYAAMRSDYAANAGSVFAGDTGGPASIEQGVSSKNWLSGSHDDFNGVSYQASEVKLSQISDGLSHTYLIGEKYVTIRDYEGDVNEGNQLEKGDNLPMYVGHDYDTLRWVARLPEMLETVYLPQKDTEVADTTTNPDGFVEHFGGSHPAGINMLFCDGSIQFITYDIEPALHLNQGARNDGRVGDTPPVTSTPPRR